MLAGLDPRAKVLIAFLFSLITVLSKNYLGLAACLLSGFLSFAGSGISWRRLLSRLAALNVFMALSWLTLPWQLSSGQVQFSPAGALLALSITLKGNAILLVWLSWLGSSPVSDILHALAHFRLPLKLLALFSLFERYVHLLSNEYNRLRAAMLVRGFKPAFSRHTFVTLAQLAAIILIRGFDRAQRVYQAMLCRGFKGTFYLLNHFHWQRRDTLLILAASLWLGGLLAAGILEQFNFAGL
jgi:cobalt/nickel transport system permease protein